MKVICKKAKDTLNIPKPLFKQMLQVCLSYLKDHKKKSSHLFKNYSKLAKDINKYTDKDECFFDVGMFDDIKHAVFIYHDVRLQYAPVTDKFKKSLLEDADSVFDGVFSSDDHDRLEKTAKIRNKVNLIDRIPNVSPDEVQRIRDWFNRVYIFSCDQTFLQHTTLIDLAWGLARVHNDLDKVSRLAKPTKNDLALLATDLLKTAEQDNDDTDSKIRRIFFKVNSAKDVEGVFHQAMKIVRADFVRIFLNTYQPVGIPFDDMMIELQSDRNYYLGKPVPKFNPALDLGVKINPRKLPNVVTKDTIAKYAHAMFVSLLYDRDRDYAKRIYNTISSDEFFNRVKGIDQGTISIVLVSFINLQTEIIEDNNNFGTMMSNTDNISKTIGKDVIDSYPINVTRQDFLTYARQMVKDLFDTKNPKEAMANAQLMNFRAGYANKVLDAKKANAQFSLPQIWLGFNKLLQSKSKNNLRFRSNMIKALEIIDKHLGFKGKPKFEDLYEKYQLTTKERLKLFWLK